MQVKKRRIYIYIYIFGDFDQIERGTEGFKEFYRNNHILNAPLKGEDAALGFHHPTTFPDVSKKKAQAWRKVLVDLLGIGEENTRKAWGPGCFHPSW